MNIEEVPDMSTQTTQNSSIMTDTTSNTFTQTESHVPRQYGSSRTFATLKPRTMEFNENGTVSEMLNKFLNKVKPIEGGIIIFKTPEWESFPQNKDDSIKIAKLWSAAFMKKKSHCNVTTNIYFDIVNKTVTFKIRPFKQTRILIKDKNFEETRNDIMSNVLEYCKNNNFNEVSKILGYEIDGCVDYPDNDIFKEESKKIANELESKLNLEENKNCKIVIFMKNDGINVTLKNTNLVTIVDNVGKVDKV